MELRDPVLRCFGWRRWFAADFADESSQHQFDLMNPGFECIMLRWSQELKISRERKKVVQFACGAQGDVKVLLQLRSSSPAATLGDICRNRKGSAAHLVRQAITLRFRERGSSPVNAQRHGVALAPDQQFAEVLHAPTPLSLYFVSFTYHLILMTYHFLGATVQC
jgi:hypothetical protein